MLRIAHLSDLHFFKMSTNIKDYFPANLLTNLNHLFVRRWFFRSDHLIELAEKLIHLDIQEVWVSGDLSVSGHPEEFILARNWLSLFKERGITVRLIPGNHDYRGYVKEFFSIFESIADFKTEEISKYHLEKDNITAFHLNEQWSIILLDTTIEPRWKRMGKFSKHHMNHLLTLLNKLKTRHVAVMCHFPLLSNEKKHRLLEGRDLLLRVLKQYPNVQLYVNGHTHLQNISQKEGIILANSGTSRGVLGTFNILDLADNKVATQSYRLSLTSSKIEWKLRKQHAFSL